MQDHDKKCEQFVVSVKKLTQMNDDQIAKIFDKKIYKAENKENAILCLNFIVTFWFKLIGDEFNKPLLQQNMVFYSLFQTLES